MTKDEALDFALEELENCADLLKVFEAPLDSCVGAAMLGAEKAITAIKQALALDKMADNGRDLGLDYEPDYKVTVADNQHPNGVPLEQWGRVAEQGEERMKKLIKDLISAMEYHVEQTRPIHSTTVALQAAREAIRAQPAPVQEPVRIYDYVWPQRDEHKEECVYACNYTPGHHLARGELLAVVHPSQLISTYLQRDNEAAHGIASPAAKRQWVGLTDEEKQEWVELMPDEPKPRHIMNLINAIEVELKEKNT
jgi:hypothetical protein